jgi:hypothetical protein
MQQQFQKLCNPAKIYFAIAFFLVLIHVFTNIQRIAHLPFLFTIVFHLMVVIAITAGVNWLCTMNLGWLSWVLVVLYALGIYRTIMGV